MLREVCLSVVPLLLLLLLSEDLTFAELLLSARGDRELFTADGLLFSLLETEGVLRVAWRSLSGVVLSTLLAGADCLSRGALTVVRLSEELCACLLLLTF